jgi:hypothetical protein
LRVGVLILSGPFSLGVPRLFDVGLSVTCLGRHVNSIP